MTSHKVKGGAGAKTNVQTAKGRSPAGAGHQPPDAGELPHYVAGQGAPGGTCDDDGNSENQQGDSGHGAAKPNTG